MLNLLLLLVGFIPLIYGANVLVDSASSLAKKLNVPNMVIGLTIVAFGTSAPELTINIIASLKGESDIALGNIIGSNIFNVAGIAGLAAIIYPIAIKPKTAWIEIPLGFLAALVVILTAGDIFLNGDKVSVINRTDGILFLLFFCIFLAYIINYTLSTPNEDEAPVKQRSVWLSIILIIAGLALLILGGKIVVMFAVKFAQQIGLSERIIALTIVAIGTSLPELAIFLIGARKKSIDIAMGNIVGSSIFNIFFILGISAIINPVYVQEKSYFDMFVNLFISILLFVFVFTGKGRVIDKKEGIIFVTLYVGYIFALLKMA